MIFFPNILGSSRMYDISKLKEKQIQECWTLKMILNLHSHLDLGSYYVWNNHHSF